ncbi:YhfG family protein [Luteibacter aegosomaticola]|uniref:YhfG family protein n=1 Tax=Luteibacter aegosomaticola TaxID=2911538 RepID=UPI001FF8E6DE|nr:YhfG family protein [Luteibacter aegosomaticola]UPG90826.1 YhfG family protein [Luteibacter aegosomaticola]
MKSPSLKDKASYYARVRETNYANSLRLEGFSVLPKMSGKSAPAALTSKKAGRNPV